jgi:flavin-dependent dehydrogenase
MAARAGFNVRLVESSAFPRHRPGETIHPGVDPLLARLGAAESVRAAGFLTHEGQWVRRGTGMKFVPYRSEAGDAWHGLQAWRATFDSILLNTARESGVDVWQPCRAVSPLIVKGRVAGARTTRGDLSADCVIDGTGSRRWLARTLGLKVQRHSRPITVEYGYASGACPQRDIAPLFDDRESHWRWTARVQPGLYHWARTLEPGESVHRGWLPEEFAGLTPVGQTRALDVTWTLVLPSAGPGYIACGDAAAVLDPSSSHGVLRALMSGILAAHLVAADIPEQHRANAYCHWLRDSYFKDVAALRQWRSSLVPENHPEGRPACV